MKKLFISSLFAATTLFAGTHGVHWGYSGHEGPEYWGEISEQYAMCKEGKNQSPVNIDSVHLTKAELQPLEVDYNAIGTDFLNNGHTVQVNFKEGSSITVDGKVFKLKQFHFHTPSENEIDSKHFPMEAHLVHVADDGELAVVAVMIEEGAKNAFMHDLAKHIPHKAQEDLSLTDTAINAKSLLPEDKSYYRFSGSLTTPPCTEGVLWLVMKHPVQANVEDLHTFESVLGHNNRPVQATHARTILQ